MNDQLNSIYDDPREAWAMKTYEEYPPDESEDN